MILDDDERFINIILNVAIIEIFIIVNIAIIILSLKLLGVI